MKIIAKNESGEYMALITHQELNVLTLGNQNAHYNDKLGPQSKTIAQQADKGTLVIDICQQYSSATSFMNEQIGTDAHGSMVYKLKSIIRQLENLEKLKTEMVEPYTKTTEESK